MWNNNSVTLSDKHQHVLAQGLHQALQNGWKNSLLYICTHYKKALAWFLNREQTLPVSPQVLPSGIFTFGPLLLEDLVGCTLPSCCYVSAKPHWWKLDAYWYCINIKKSLMNDRISSVIRYQQMYLYSALWKPKALDTVLQEKKPGTYLSHILLNVSSWKVRCKRCLSALCVNQPWWHAVTL